MDGWIQKRWKQRALLLSNRSRMCQLTRPNYIRPAVRHQVAVELGSRASPFFHGKNGIKRKRFYLDSGDDPHVAAPRDELRAQIYRQTPTISIRPVNSSASSDSVVIFDGGAWK